MTDGMLLAFRSAIFFIFLSGAYVYMRENPARENRAARPREVHNELGSAVQLPGTIRR